MKPIKIYKVCSPSKHISDREIKDVRKITISFGGGMGGVNNIYYGASLVVMSNNFYSIVTHKGEFIDINKRFIVLIERCKLAEIVSDVTEHSHHNKEKHDKLIQKIYYELKENETYEYVDKQNNDLNNLYYVDRILEPF